MDVRTISWIHNSIRIIDQTKLPGKFTYLYIKDLRTLWRAIRELRIRGAPALGAASALGIYLGVKNSRAKTYLRFCQQMHKLSRYLGSSRPTARNLFWGLERVGAVVQKHRGEPISVLKELILREALDIIEEDRVSCRKIGEFGAGMITDRDAILTICNAGALATIDYGTALGAIYRAKKEGKSFKVYACETRPLLQGARLTTWELMRNRVEVTLICDSMAAALMRQQKITKVITGADRIAANGDTANKIGTYAIAILAHHHRIPFYVAAPLSTFDVSFKNGDDIPIEERSSEEVTKLFFKRPIAPEGVKVFNPAFDLTPANLIDAIITDYGIVRPPYTKNIPAILKQGQGRQ